MLHPDDGPGSIYPFYGLAPHRHDMGRTGSLVGSTVEKPREEWPANFCEDKDAPGMGTYTHCLSCGAGDPS